MRLRKMRNCTLLWRNGDMDTYIMCPNKADGDDGGSASRNAS